MEKLAGKVEALAGPDRDVDALIAPLQGLRIVEEGHPLGRCCYDENGILVVFPSYTRSLDAAMSLLDPSWFFHLSRFSPECDGRGQAHVYPNRGLGDDYESEAATPALALTAAALRARAPIPSSRREGLES